MIWIHACFEGIKIWIKYFKVITDEEALQNLFLHMF